MPISLSNILRIKETTPFLPCPKAAASSSACLNLLTDGSLVKLGDGIGRPGDGGFLSCLSLIAYLLCAPLIALDRRGLCSSIALDRAADLSFAFANRDDPVGIPRWAHGGLIGGDLRGCVCLRRERMFFATAADYECASLEGWDGVTIVVAIASCETPKWQVSDGEDDSSF